MKTLNNNKEEDSRMKGIEFLNPGEMFQIRGGYYDKDKTGTKEEDVYPTKEDFLKQIQMILDQLFNL